VKRVRNPPTLIYITSTLVVIQMKFGAGVAFDWTAVVLGACVVHSMSGLATVEAL